MYSEEKKIIIRVVENFIRTGAVSDEQVTVTNLPPGKTSHVEQTGSMDVRSCSMNIV